MSLINDALKDLDSRSDNSHINNDGHTQSGHRGVEQSSASIGISSRVNWRYFVVPGVLIITAVFVLDVRNHDAVTRSLGLDSVAVGTDNDISISVNENTERLKTQPEAIDDSVAVHEGVVSGNKLPRSEKHSPPSLDNAQTRESLIAFYLEKADKAIARNRLSVPVEGNALFFLAKVRELDPDNTRAESMHRDIQSSYLNQITFALDNHHFRRAKTLISRSGVFGINDLEIKSYLTRLSQGIEHGHEGDSSEGMLSSTLQFKGEPESGPVNGAISPTTFSTDNAEKTKWVTVTSESEDLHYVDQIKERISQGDEQQAIAELAGRVKQKTDVLNSEIFLFDYYIRRSEFDNAQKLLNSLDKNHLASDYFNAQLTHHFHGPVRAISILESSTIFDEKRSLIKNRQLREKQNAFLAALYQKTEAYKKAQAIYAALLREDQNNTQYTLGFALAADADGNRFSALTAYRKISTTDYQNGSVVEFVKKRIAILEANDLAEATRW